MSKNLIALQNKFLGHGQTIYDELAKVHHEKGCVTDEDILRLAHEHRLPPQHVRATAKFYDELSQTKPAKHTVKVCNGEACFAAGCKKLQDQLSAGLGLSMGATSDAGVRLEHVTCLGYCGMGPNAMVDGLPVSLAAPEAVDAVVRHVQDKSTHGLTEPTNPVYPPRDQPCVLMRHFEKDVVDLAAARKAGIYTQLQKALTTLTPAQIIDQLKASGLRGRGGAGFPAHIKLQTVANSSSKDGRKFVVVNCDEGDAGAYIDKELLERDPHTHLEGLLLAAYACGATDAYIYIRFEYPRALNIMHRAIDQAMEAGLVGQNILGSSFNCTVKIVRGQGAYICGEETSLLRSIEGLPALVSPKPPFPAVSGLWGCPTAVCNVESLHNMSWIIEHGGAAYARFGKGHERSRGTKALSINTRVRRPGMYEIEMGMTLRHVIFDLAGGMAPGQRFKAVQVGGPLGGIFPESLLDTRLEFEDMAAKGGLLGHGSIVVYSHEDDLVQVARGLMAFTAVESCGKCFPCRIGSVRGTELLDQMMDTGVTDVRLNLLTELCETMRFGSLCALGGLAPTPIESLMNFFPEEFARYRRETATVTV